MRHFHTCGEGFHAHGGRLPGALVMLAGQFDRRIEGIRATIEHLDRRTRMDDTPLALDVLDGDDHGSAPGREISGKVARGDCDTGTALQD